MTSVAETPFWSLHTHSRFSAKDALPSVERIVERAHQLGYPALGMTDHGNPTASIPLYKACRRYGIEPLPGMELYVVPDTEYATRKGVDPNGPKHLTMAAYTEVGYRNLCKVATLSARRFHFKPRVDFADFAKMAHDGDTKGLAIGTGCYFGVLPQVLMRQGPRAARKVAETLAGWFPRVYVELQNHGIDEHHSDLDVTDDELIAALYDLANESGLPMVVTRDSHYIDEADKPLHEAYKRLVTFSDDPDEATFPGGGYHMTDTEGMRKFFEPRYLNAGLEGLADLASAAHVRLPELETFTLKVPDVAAGGNPQDILEAKVWAAYKASPLADDWPTQKQIASELQVIKDGDMASYLLLCLLVVGFMNEKTIRFCVRGSAQGSMVLYVLGVTQLNPIVFKLRFSRFLSHNRMKPPDVDFDVEHERRDEVVAFLMSRWSVRAVGTLAKYGLDDESEEADGKGSLKQALMTTRRKLGLPKLNWNQIPRVDRDALYTLSKMKLISGYGSHPCGYIVAPDEATVSQLPMAWIASSKKLVTAIDKKGVEQLGFTKLDLLGSKTQTAVRIAQELSGVNFETIPTKDKPTFSMIARGWTAGVFQLTAPTAARGCREVKPTKLEDIIAIQALYRPATMHSGATKDFIARRNKDKPVPERHKDIMSATADTYGVLLYQESVMDVLESLGMSPAELEDMLDAVKASNEYSVGAAAVIKEMMPRIMELAHFRGWEDADVDWLEESLAGYADYSFNRAHAASYGIISYRQAYMKKNHTMEFWAGVLVAYTDTKAENRYLAEARKDSVRIYGPQVNLSGVSYTMDPSGQGIRKGLLSIKGVGKTGAKELVAKAPYSSLRDLGERVSNTKVHGAKHLAIGKHPTETGKTAILALFEAGALDKLIEADTEAALEKESE